ncbi:MAG: hypothetical protein GEU98_21610 [Pseudonocardiaceae bacterium]|nr:hypothetical protein [Pseudonocardiaceae bacterium]
MSAAPPAHQPRVTLRLLQVVATVTALAALAQPVLAGGYLSGAFDFLGYHELTGHLLTGLILLQVIAAGTYMWPGRGGASPLLLSIAQFLAAGAQVGMGYSRNLAVHIPLGVFVVLLSVAICVWTYRPAARLPRRRARGTT